MMQDARSDDTLDPVRAAAFSLMVFAALAVWGFAAFGILALSGAI